MPVNSGLLREKEDFQRLIMEYLRDDNGYQIRNAGTDFNECLYQEKLTSREKEKMEAPPDKASAIPILGKSRI
jgi:hypothetical protein